MRNNEVRRLTWSTTTYKPQTRMHHHASYLTYIGVNGANIRAAYSQASAVGCFGDDEIEAEAEVDISLSVLVGGIKKHSLCTAASMRIRRHDLVFHGWHSYKTNHNPN